MRGYPSIYPPCSVPDPKQRGDKCLPKNDNSPNDAFDGFGGLRRQNVYYFRILKTVISPLVTVIKIKIFAPAAR